MKNYSIRLVFSIKIFFFRTKFSLPPSFFFLFSSFLLSSFLSAQTFTDGPIELKTRVREVYVSYSPSADASLNFGGQNGFNPDELTFKVWTQDNGNFSGLGWVGGTCLQDDFDPPLASVDFNYMMYNYVYPTSTVPQFFEIRMDSWQNNCGSDGAFGNNCVGSRCTFQTNCCCVQFFGCQFTTSDNNHCDANPFQTQMNYRLGSPCQWYDHGNVNSTACTSYQPHIESYWRYIKGTGIDTNAIPLGNIVPGGVNLSHFNSNECYSNNYPFSAGNDVFYSFTTTQPIGLKISLCAAAIFNTDLYLLDSTGTQIVFNDSFCSNTSEIQTAICIPGTYYVVVDADSASDMGTFTLTISEDPTQIVHADAGIDKMICYGTSATLGGSPAAAGGVPDYIYEWIPSSNLSSADSANPQAFPPPGINEYVLSVTDSAGCVVTDTMLLTVNPGPDINLGNDTTICSGDFLILDAGFGYVNYFWSNGVNTSFTTAFLPTLYFVSVFDLFGCIGTDTIAISIHPVSSLNLGTDTSICLGDNITFNAGNFETYDWNIDSANSSITVNTAGIYSVQTTDTNDCIYNDTVSLDVNPLPVVSLGNDVTICPNTSVTLNPGGGFTSYLWIDNSINQTLNVNNAGTYFVKVSNSFNCFNSDTINVSMYPQPEVNLGADTNICLGNSMALNAGSGFSVYSWNTTANSQSITIIAGGTFIVTVTDANGCTDADSIVVAQNPQLSSQINSTDDITCYGLNNGSVSVLASGGTTPFVYLWSNGANSSSVNNLSKGIYTITVTDSKGCSSALTAFIDEPTQLVMNFSTTDPLCEGVNSGEINLNVFGGITPYSYLWSNGEITSSLFGLPPSGYSVTISDANNCEANQTFIINSPLPLFMDIDVIDASCTGGDNGSAEVQVFGGKSPYSYLWGNGVETQSIASLQSGNYSVTVTDANGCKGSDTAKVDELKIKIDEDLITIPNVFTPNGDNANDYFKISSEVESINDYEMTIFNRWGELIYKTKNISDKWDGKFKGKDIAEGVYFCSLRLSVKCLGQEEIITKSSSVTLIR